MDHGTKGTGLTKLKNAVNMILLDNVLWSVMDWWWFLRVDVTDISTNIRSKAIAVNCD